VEIARAEKTPRGMVRSVVGVGLALALGVEGCSSTVTSTTSRSVTGASAAVTPSLAPRWATAEVVNASRPTRCAEEDNVYVKLRGDGLKSLRIEARHPGYAAQLTTDSYAPDFSDCHFDEASHPTDPKYAFTPKRVILWENEQYLMVGNTHESFWRPDEVDFVVGDKVEKQIHLVQLYRKDKDEPKLGRHQFLVLYPPDGYWRAKPLPTPALNYGVYGTSFLVGPVQEAGRPVVEIARVEFVPATMTFALTYEDGSHGRVAIDEVSRERIALDYTHDRALPSDKPLAAIRSMFVTAEKSDAAEVGFRESVDAPRKLVPLPTFDRAEVSEVSFGRSVPSRHNSSAPDMWFGRFAR